MPQEFALNESSYAVWKALEVSGRLDVGQLVETTGVDQSQVTAAASEAAELGFFVLEERSRDELLVTDSAASAPSSGVFRPRAWCRTS